MKTVSRTCPIELGEPDLQTLAVSGRPSPEYVYERTYFVFEGQRWALSFVIHVTPSATSFWGDAALVTPPQHTKSHPCLLFQLPIVPAPEPNLQSTAQPLKCVAASMKLSQCTVLSNCACMVCSCPPVALSHGLREAKTQTHTFLHPHKSAPTLKVLTRFCQSPPTGCSPASRSLSMRSTPWPLHSGSQKPGTAPSSPSSPRTARRCTRAPTSPCHTP